MMPVEYKNQQVLGSRSEAMRNLELTPFLKWAGGKRWLTSSHPEVFHVPFSRYIEPFLGSGAVFFRIGPARAILSDKNRDLIATYQAVKDRPELVVRYLKEYQARHSSEYYYEVRSSRPRSRFRSAAKFIYLNRTCWNALYRVNLKGEFNVPVGTKSSVLLESDDFSMVSEMLQRADLIEADFEEIIDQCGIGDFLFVDPPYTVKHNLNGFVKYNEQIFSWNDQVRLREAIVRASARGAKFLMTNANHESVRELYAGQFDEQVLARHSIIAASSRRRERTTELLISNY